MALKKKQIQALKDKMILEKERILASSALDSDNLEIQTDQQKDESDVANAEVERSRMLRFRNRDIFYAKKLEKALIKLNNNEYGLCEECDDTIKFERLLARPTAQLCIGCKDESERAESGNFIARQSKSLNETFKS
jgi:DnaK suppressor protein